MNDLWQEVYKFFFDAGKLDRLVALMGEQAMMVGRIACQVGQTDESRRDALAEMRFCLSKADDAAKALTAMREQANSRASEGFQKGGAALA